jgi:putative nucleotidyltransferase with HDIG domain
MLANSPLARRRPRLTRREIEEQIRYCARLPSLGSINQALRELINAEQRYTSHVAEIIRRDPSLTARLLRLVNSVYYGLSTPINNIEEAVFYLGIRQIRQLAMVTPIIEDFQRLTGRTRFDWRAFWQHCIGTAIMTREIIGSVQPHVEEVDYVAGLVHDVGKITMAAVFPDYFGEIHFRAAEEDRELVEIENDILGIDHAELGALYLKNHKLPEALIETARFHHQPERATFHGPIVAAVQIADLLVRHARIGRSGNNARVSEEDLLNASGWAILSPHQTDAEQTIARASLKRSLERLPTILEGLV